MAEQVTKMLKAGERRRSDGRYEYRWSDETGKRRSTCSNNLRELREKERLIAAGLYDNPIANPKKKEKEAPIVSNLFYTWLKTKITLRPTSYQKLVEQYRRYIEPEFATMRIEKIKNSDLKCFYNYLLIDRDLSKSTIKKVHNELNQMFELAVENGIIDKNPAAKAFREIALSPDKESKRNKADHLTKEQQNSLLDFMKNSAKYLYWYPAIATLVGTGMRLGEFAGLRWANVDFEKRTITVDHTVSYYYQDAKKCSDFVFNDTKTKSSKRTIPLSEMVIEALRMQQEYQEIAEVKRPELDGITDFCFHSSRGHLINEQRINHVIEGVIRDHNAERPDNPLPRFSCHTLRHTFATRLSEAHIAIKAAQAILGHSDFQTTYNIYVGVDESFVMQEFMNAEFDKITGSGAN